MPSTADVSYAPMPDAPDGTPPEAARAGDLVFFAGGIAAHPATGIAPEIHPHPELPNHWSHIRAQLMHIYGRMGRALEIVGLLHARLPQDQHLPDETLEETFDALNLRENYFGGEAPPPSTLVYVPALAVPGLTVTNDLIAVASDAELGRVAITTSTDDAPIPPLEEVFGHRIYIKATRGGGFIFTAGLTNNTRHLIPGAEVPEHPDFPYRHDLAKLSTEITLQDLGGVAAGDGRVAGRRGARRDSPARHAEPRRLGRGLGSVLPRRPARPHRGAGGLSRAAHRGRNRAHRRGPGRGRTARRRS